ncbi:hypothetical protein ICNMLN_ICNMLN_15170, partial [Dysosmobacter welbionis]
DSTGDIDKGVHHRGGDAQCMAHGSQRYQAGHGILHDEPVLGIGRVAQSAIGFDALNQIIQA